MKSCATAKLRVVVTGNITAVRCIAAALLSTIKLMITALLPPPLSCIPSSKSTTPLLSTLLGFFSHIFCREKLYSFFSKESIDMNTDYKYIISNCNLSTCHVFTKDKVARNKKAEHNLFLSCSES